MNSNNPLSSRFKRWNRAHFSITFTVLLIAVMCSSFYFIHFVQPATENYQQGNQQLRRLTNVTTSSGGINCQRMSINNTSTIITETQNVLFQVCQNAKMNLSISLETEKEIHRKTNATLIEQIKLCQQQQQKNQTDNSLRKNNSNNNSTTITSKFDRKLFNYMSTFLRDTPYPGVENYSRYTVARLGMSHLTGIEPLKPEYGPVINNVTSLRYPLTIPPCHHQNGNVSINENSVFIAVISAPGNFDKRNTIRRTWRNHLKVEYHKNSMSLAGFAFILGLTDHNETQMKIEQEATTYGDLIQIEMADFYRNLSLKVAGLFNWLYKYCHQKIDFLFKVDDDVYVNVHNLVQFVKSHNRSDQSIFGLSAVNLFPARGGKWGVTMEEWPWRDYPRYFYGPAVIFPGRTILRLLAAFQTTPLMPIDDLYYSGICIEKANVTIRCSINSTSVFTMVPPVACNVRLYVSWLTSSANQMNHSHWITEDFYHHNRSQQCVVAGTNGHSNMTIDPNEPVNFYFE